MCVCVCKERRKRKKKKKKIGEYGGKERSLKRGTGAIYKRGKCWRGATPESSQPGCFDVGM